MDISKCSIFVWKGEFFSVQLQGNAVTVKWSEIISEALEGEGRVSNSSDGNLDKQPVFSSTCLQLEGEESLTVVTSGFSFDNQTLTHIPVVIIGAKPVRQKGKNSTNEILPAALYIVGVRERNATKRRTSNTKIQLELVVLQKILLGKKLKDVSEVRVTDFLNIILLWAKTATIKLSSDGSFSTQSLVKTTCAEEVVNLKSMQNLNILSVFSNIITHEIFILFRFMDSKSKMVCQCVKYVCKPSPNKISQQDSQLEQVSIDHLFSADYSNILTAVTITSLGSKTQSFGSNSMVYSSCVFMITNTGYALRFVNGHMLSCVYLWNSLQDTRNETCFWQDASYNIVHTWNGLREKTAVQVNNECLLVDWDDEKVCNSWEGVRHICGCRRDARFPSHLVIFFTCDGASLEQQRDNILVVNCFLNKVILEDDQGSQSDQKLPPQCVQHVLLAQKKMYESIVKDTGAELKVKEEFITQAWTKIQNLQSSNRESHPQSPIHSKLVPLFPGSPESESVRVKLKDHSTARPVASYLPVNKQTHVSPKSKGSALRGNGEGRIPRGNMHDNAQGSTPGNTRGNTRNSHVEIVTPPWTRTLEILLIVGITVRNTSDRSVNNAHIHLLSVSPISSPTLEVISTSEQSDLGERSTIASASEKTLTCWVHTGQLLSPRGISVRVHLTYCVDTEVDRNMAHVDTCCIECGEITLTQNDLLTRKFSLTKSLQLSTNADRDEDLQALDCVQSPIHLLVKSLVSPVQCLGLNLASHSDLLTVHDDQSSFGHFVYIADHDLQLCQIKGLKQTSKYEAQLQIWTRHASQASLLVTFLKSVVPDDVTFELEPEDSTSAVHKICGMLHNDLQTNMKKIASPTREGSVHMKDCTNSCELNGRDGSHINVDSEPVPASPTFHSKKGSKVKEMSLKGKTCKTNLPLARPLRDNDVKTSFSRKRLGES